jgi:putative transposase
MQRSLREDVVLRLIRKIRTRQPRVGGRKLYKMLQQTGIQIGRDRLFKILRENKLLIKSRRNFKKTTNSYHRFFKHRNLIKDFTVTAPNQVLVSDITYLDTQERPCYLFLITDYY